MAVCNARSITSPRYKYSLYSYSRANLFGDFIESKKREGCSVFLRHFLLLCRCLNQCVCFSEAFSIRATTALAVEPELTKSVWKWSPSVKSVGVSFSHAKQFSFLGQGAGLRNIEMKTLQHSSLICET